MNDYTETLLQALHGAIAQGLAEKIASGEATPAEYSAAIRFLKDNGVQQTLAEGNQIDILNEKLAGVDLPSMDELEEMTDNVVNITRMK